MNKWINNCTKSYPTATNPELKLWWGLKLTLMLVVCGTSKPTICSSSPYFNASSTCIRLSKHQLEQISQPFFSIADTITYNGSAILCPGGSLLLSAENAPSNALYKWFKDGNVIPIATTATYTVTTPGSYSVTTEYNGITNNYPSLLITQDSAPVAQFKYTSSGDCPSSTVNFINMSTGDGLTYSWNFGDPNSVKGSRTSNLANPSHVFIGTTGNGSQTFNVTLIITTKGGCTSTATNTITLFQSPDTKLGGTGSVVFNGRSYFAQCTNTPSTFTFTNLSGTDNSSYNIYWGDGSGSTTLNNFTTITHTYRVGNFTMFYTVYGKNGCSIVKKYYVFVGKSPIANVSNSTIFTCTNTPVVIQTYNMDDNSAGTIYTVNFSDGVSNFYTASTPDTIMHTFFSNSINKTSQKQSVKFINSYSATLIASNPCGADTAIIAPIYVSDIPKASLTVNSNTICVGDSIMCANKNSGSVYIDSTGNPHPENFIWTVNPNNGYIVNPSSLGQNYAKNTPSLWLNGSSNFNIKFTTAGYYTLKLITGNDYCGIDSAIKSICVNPLPVALFSLSDSSDCAPFSVRTTNQSNTPLCGLNSYKWTVSYSNNGCDGYTGNFSYKSGDSNSVSPEFNFTDPGIYTINLLNTYTSSQCSSAVFSKQVTVRGNPIIAISLPNKGFTNQKLQPAGLLKDCNTLISPTFLWLFPGGEPSSSIAFQPDSIVYKHAGIYNISYSVTNECGTTTTNQNISITDNLSLSNAFIPNSFTPNGDGINDTWNINSIEQNHSLFLQVFNRYGQLVSQIKGNPITWDGTYKGEKLPAGVYFYVLSIYNDSIHPEKRSGSVTIIY